MKAKARDGHATIITCVTPQKRCREGLHSLHFNEIFFTRFSLAFHCQIHAVVFHV